MKTYSDKKGSAYVIYFEGKINYETQDGIRDHLDKLLRGMAPPKGATVEDKMISSSDTSTQLVVFNFEKLEFVGSTGITAFLQLLSDFSVKAPIRTSLCHVGSEFRQMIRALTPVNPWDLFETEDQAVYCGPRPRLDQ